MAPSPDKTSGFEYSKEKTVSDYPKSSRNKDRYRYTETAADIVYPGKINKPTQDFEVLNHRKNSYRLLSIN